MKRKAEQKKQQQEIVEIENRNKRLEQEEYEQILEIVRKDQTLEQDIKDMEIYQEQAINIQTGDSFDQQNVKIEETKQGYDYHIDEEIKEEQENDSQSYNIPSENLSNIPSIIDGTTIIQETQQYETPEKSVSSSQLQTSSIKQMAPLSPKSPQEGSNINISRQKSVSKSSSKRKNTPVRSNPVMDKAQERALERKNKREEIQRRKQEKKEAEEREKIEKQKQEQLEIKRKKKEEAQLIKLKRQKEAEKRAKAEERRKINAQNMQKAAEFYESRLAKRVFTNGLQKLLEIKSLNSYLANKFRESVLKTTAFENF